MEETAIILQNENDKPIPSRVSVLLCLEECRRDLKNKLDHGRFKSPALEKARNEKIRLLITCCQVMAGIMKDADLDDLKKRLDALEDER